MTNSMWHKKQIKNKHMKKILLVLHAAFTLIISGCFKDDCKSVRRIYKPVYKTLTQIRADMKGGAEKPITAVGKIYLYNNYIFLNEPDKGIHVIDNSNPAHPENISFINIPGNYDLAIQGNFLYADSYSDLVVFDISDPVHAVSKEFENNVFPFQSRYFYNGFSNNPDSILVPVGFKMIDTLVDCEMYNTWAEQDYGTVPNASQIIFTALPSVTGIGGSTARFTISNNYLYTVDYTSIYSFSLADVSHPALINNTDIVMNTHTGIETIFPFEDKLFIGSQDGMFIYKVSDPSNPAYLGEFGHVRVCDPVIADNNNAYVTLRSGSVCQGFTNELDVLDITTDITNPVLIKTYGMTNPRGLSKDGNLLFICDGQDGLKVYDASDVNELVLKKQFNGFEANDVIAYNNVALVIAIDGLYQYDYSNASGIKLLSKIPITAQ